MKTFEINKNVAIVTQWITFVQYFEHEKDAETKEKEWKVRIQFPMNNIEIPFPTEDEAKTCYEQVQSFINGEKA